MKLSLFETLEAETMKVLIALAGLLTEALHLVDTVMQLFIAWGPPWS